MLPAVNYFELLCMDMTPTESRTPLKARISASMLSFLACNCAKDKPFATPFVCAGVDVGPEGTVGA